MRRISALVFCGILCATVPLVGAEKPDPHEATHKQVEKIVPQRNGRPVTLNTFTLDSKGNILACVVDMVASPQTDQKEKSDSWLQVYSPEGELVRETALPFNATAINQAPSGIVFLAGDGQVGKVDAKGKLLTTADAPNLGDRDAMRKKAEKDAAEQIKQVTSMFATQLERVEKMIKTLKEKDELSDRDKKRLTSLEAQQKLYGQQQEGMKEAYSQFFSVDAMMANAMKITSLAVNSKDVFLCCRTGRGYEVWRMDHDFSSPTSVVSGLSGCCGQCDIQADEENLVLAENTKFKVSLLDREGERLTSFGSRRGESGDGFGSCCNPMNVRCCSNGDILTAESSIGLIKRYNKEGDYLGTVGKARIGGGCKHVAIGFDEKRDRYYMQYEDKNQICVMWPLSEAPEFTAEELEAKTAMEGLGRKLLGNDKTKTGEWSRTGKRPVAKSSSGLFGAFGSLLAGTTTSSEDNAEDAAAVPENETTSPDQLVANMGEGTVSYFKFSPDGKLEIRGGYMEGGENGWAPVSQDLKTNSLIFSQFHEGIQYYNYRVEFVDDDTAKFTMMYGEQEMQAYTFKRVMPPKNQED